MLPTVITPEDSLHQRHREFELEQSMLDQGRRRYFKSVTSKIEHSSESSTKYGTTLMKHAIEPLAAAFEAFLSPKREGRAGRQATSKRFLSRLSPETLAFITLRHSFDTISSTPMSLQGIAATIGREIEFESKIGHLANVDYKAYDYTFRCMEFTGVKQRHYRKASFLKTFTNSSLVSWTPWDNAKRIQIGMKCIELLIATTGLFEITKPSSFRRFGKSELKTLRATEKLTAYIHQFNEYHAFLSPVYMPTIIPPKPWEGAFGGGYWHSGLPVVPLVKTSNKAFLLNLDNHLRNGGAPVVLSAVNAMQQTAWRINPRVFEVASHLWNNALDEGVAGLPPRSDVPYPPCPVCGADVTENAKKGRADHECLTALKARHPDRFKDWKRQCILVNKFNVSQFGKRINVSRILSQAERYLDEPRFYFPYQLDFRGRIYALPSYLNPQSGELSKGLLEFAEGKAVGSEKGPFWLAVHGANRFGMDKTSFEERLRWVSENEASILKAAEAPLDFTWWMDADEPFSFLAFCFEWAGYKAEGSAFVSHIPVAMDGSCNGLQIFSLMLRDEVGGKAVNLTPEETPQDIYGIVAERVIAQLSEDNREGGENAALASLFLSSGSGGGGELSISRKTTKRQVMVLPYGGTFLSCLNYTGEWLSETITSKYGNPAWRWDDVASFRAARLYLSKIIWKAIGDVVIAAKEAMSFLQKLASVASSDGKPIWWTTPVGLPVWQAYYEKNFRRIKCHSGDTVYWFGLNEETRKISVRKQRSGMSPNYVHSLDAAALMLTVHNCLTMGGITSFAMIHDSYGTHAADSQFLAEMLRQVFVKMFSDNLLENLLEGIKSQVPGKPPGDFPPVPVTGTLDITSVLESRFFFA